MGTGGHGLGDLAPVFLEEHLLGIFGIARDQLYRLALFLLVHALVDRHIILGNAFARIREQGKFVDNMPEEETAAFIHDAAQRTFTAHLNESVERGLLPDGCEEIAREINRGRDHFLHWVPRRFWLPKYRGIDVTRDDFAYVSDALMFLGAVPFERPARDAMEDSK